MATWTQVDQVLRPLKGIERVESRGLLQWKLKTGLVAWQRPLRKTDLAALGDAAPAGEILGVRVPLEVKEALLASKRGPYFTIPHFDGYAAILIELKKIRLPALRKLLLSAWAERSKTKK